MTRTDEKFGIEFVDPDELIQFIEENRDRLPEYPEKVNDSKPVAPIPSRQLEEQQSELDLEEIDEEEGFDLALSNKIAEEASEYVTKKQEDTRGRLAVIYTICTFLVFAVGFAISVLDGLIRNVSIIDNLSTILPLLSGFFLGTLGFVIGYYFRKDE